MITELPEGMMHTPREMAVGEVIDLPIYTHLCDGDFMPMMNVIFIYMHSEHRYTEYYLEYDIHKTANTNKGISFDKLRVVYNVVGSKEYVERKYDGLE